jgi:hypothetical protein
MGKEGKGKAALRRCAPSPSRIVPPAYVVFSRLPRLPLAGKYWVDSRPAVSSNDSYDRAVQAKLWEVSAELTEAAMRPLARKAAASAPAVEAPAAVSAPATVSASA